MIRTLFNIANWMLNHALEDLDEILHNFTAKPDPEPPAPWGHTLTLTVGPSDDLTYEWRCHEPLSAFCREDREESDGCLFIERIEDSGTPWNQLTFDGWDEEFPPLQVDFVDQAGQLHWYGVQEPGS